MQNAVVYLNIRNAKTHTMQNIKMTLPSGKVLSIAHDNFQLSVHVHGSSVFTHIHGDAFNVMTAIQKAIQDDIENNMHKG